MQVNTIINNQLRKYQANSLEDEENALKEIIQEIALYALSTTDFFSHALFQGGTSLRILYDLPRFSEDLDFILKSPDHNFQWEKYIEEIKKVFSLYGIEPEIQDRSKADTVIQKLFLKDNSIGKIINLNFNHHSHRKFLIKFEIDTNPPEGSNEERKFLDFPIDYAISTQDLSSNFSGKCHALLCRPYTKGRDWFDFSWYITQGVRPNLDLLENALRQAGPWQDKKINLTGQWLVNSLEEKISEINWQEVSMEVRRFINLEQAGALRLWSKDFFMAKTRKLSGLIGEA